MPAELLENMPDKQTVVDRLVLFLDSTIVQWCEEVDLPSLCSSSHKQLLELKVRQKELCLNLLMLCLLGWNHTSLRTSMYVYVLGGARGGAILHCMW